MKINILLIYDNVILSDMRIPAFQKSICLYLQVEILSWMGYIRKKSKQYDTWMNKLKIISSDCDAHSFILKDINTFYLQKNLFST
jgi:hypothetical protein